MKIKNAVLFVVYVIFLVLLLILILEFGARRQYQESYLTAHVADNSVYHHLPLPHFKGRMHSEGDFDDTYTTNNVGMRGPGDYTYNKSKDVYRIAVLGDSFVFGVGVKADQTASSLIEKKLNAPNKRKYQIYNFGVCSYSPILEWLYLKKEVVKYHPDLVILFLDLCDIQDDYLYEPHLIHDERGEVIGCDPYRRQDKPDLWALTMKHSFFLRIADEKLFQSFRKIKTIGCVKYFQNKFKKIRNKTEILTNPDIDNIDFDRFLFCRPNKNPAIVDKYWERSARYLLRIKRFCDVEGISFILTSYPYGQFVGANQWAKGREYWAFEKNRQYDGTPAFDRIRNFANEKDIDFIDLYPAMLEHTKETLYYNNDGHWTARGQEVAAEAILESKVFKAASKEKS